MTYYHVVHFENNITFYFDGVGQLVADKSEAFRYTHAQAGRIIYLLIEKSKKQGNERKFLRVNAYGRRDTAPQCIDTDDFDQNIVGEDVQDELEKAGSLPTYEQAQAEVDAEEEPTT